MNTTDDISSQTLGRTRTRTKVLAVLALIAVIGYAVSRPSNAISFEAANPRHAHEWTVFETVKLPDRLDDFAALGARVVGVSTQEPDEQARFAARNRIQFPLVSDVDLGLATALRLPPLPPTP